MPHGGKYQMTETQAMVAKLPVMNGKCDTVTMMSYGFDPYLSSWSPYHGAVYAYRVCCQDRGSRWRLQQDPFYIPGIFPQNDEDPKRWSQPFAALLGAIRHRLVSDFRQSEERTACPEHLNISMYRRHWYPLQLTLPRRRYHYSGTEKSR